MNIVIVGHVDHGKSTLIGRLLADTNSIPKGKLEHIKEQCIKNGKPFEYAFLLDALKEEQAQGITIDMARCFFNTKKRNYTILDAPGHIEFLKNMITGADKAETAILVVDASEGIRENSKRHAYMLSMLGIKQVVVVINKMDLVNYDKNVYDNLVYKVDDYLKKLNIKPIKYIPISARCGDNIACNSKKMTWYQGNVLETLDKLICQEDDSKQSFRMPVQDVYKFTENDDTRRIIVGTIEGGKIRLGDKVVFYPSKKEGTINTIEKFPNDVEIKEISCGYATGFTLKEQIYIKRGELMTLKEEESPIVSNRIKARVFWLGKNRLVKGKEYYIKIGTQKVKGYIEEIKEVLDTSTLIKKNGEFVETNEVAQCIIKFNENIAFDISKKVEFNTLKTNRFVIVENYEICGGGVIDENYDKIITNAKIKSTNIVWQNTKVCYNERCNLLNQRGVIVWLFGLSGSGKSTIAIETEKRLYQNGYLTYILDGDNIRHGLNKDLGFDKESREENIRRVVEVAKLFKDAGLITFVCCITPYEIMREYIRNEISENNLIEVFIQADINTCYKRDPKRLYEKQIPNFTGITAPFEYPKTTDIVINTESQNIDECVKILISEILLRQSKEELQ